MRALRARLRESPAGGRRIVLLIDEFSDIYKELLAQTIQRQFMRAWKSITEQRFFSAVLVGQDIMQRFKQDFPNEFGVIEDQRLSYLSFREARDLIEVPVGADRYLPGAVDRILELTAASPYYTMMFCKRLVDYANEYKALRITSAEVNEVLYSMVKGHNRLALDKFDCLLIAGDSERDSGIPVDAALAVCRAVADDVGMGVCPESVVMTRVPDSAAVLDDLVQREVLERTGDGVRIRVGLFAEWLARN